MQHDDENAKYDALVNMIDELLLSKKATNADLTDAKNRQEATIADLSTQLDTCRAELHAMTTEAGSEKAAHTDEKAAHAVTKNDLAALQAAHEELEAKLLATQASLTDSTDQLNTCQDELTEAAEDKAGHTAATMAFLDKLQVSLDTHRVTIADENTQDTAQAAHAVQLAVSAAPALRDVEAAQAKDAASSESEDDVAASELQRELADALAEVEALKKENRGLKGDAPASSAAKSMPEEAQKEEADRANLARALEETFAVVVRQKAELERRENEAVFDLNRESLEAIAAEFKKVRDKLRKMMVSELARGDAAEAALYAALKAEERSSSEKSALHDAEAAQAKDAPSSESRDDVAASELQRDQDEALVSSQDDTQVA